MAHCGLGNWGDPAASKSAAAEAESEALDSMRSPRSGDQCAPVQAVSACGVFAESEHVALSSPALSPTQLTYCSARERFAAARDHAVQIELPMESQLKLTSGFIAVRPVGSFHCERAVPVSVLASHGRGYLMPQDARV